MARPFIMVKTIKGIEYAYLYKDVILNDRHQPELIRYLGRLDLLVKALNSVLKKRGRKPLR